MMVVARAPALAQSSGQPRVERFQRQCEDPCPGERRKERPGHLVGQVAQEEQESVEQDLCEAFPFTRRATHWEDHTWVGVGSGDQRPGGRYDVG
jgi:hypothetical protein